MIIHFSIDNINHKLSGVGLANQMHRYYDTQLTFFRTSWPMLFWAYDTIVTNVYLIDKNMP